MAHTEDTQSPQVSQNTGGKSHWSCQQVLETEQGPCPGSLKLPAPALPTVSLFTCSVSICLVPITVIIKVQFLGTPSVLGPVLGGKDPGPLSHLWFFVPSAPVECLACIVLQPWPFVQQMLPKHLLFAGHGTSQVDKTHPGPLGAHSAMGSKQASQPWQTLC